MAVVPLRSERRAKDAPETLVDLPTNGPELTRKALEIIEQCRVSVGTRVSFYKQIYSIVSNGMKGPGKSLVNLLPGHLDRLASHLFSPVELRFKVGYVYEYSTEYLKRATIAGRTLTADFSHRSADLTFARGVYEALQYGSCLFKQWTARRGSGTSPFYESSLVMPWQFGVYREDQVDLNKQPAMVETIMLTLPEVWRTIAHLPNRRELYQRIKAHANRGQSGDEFNSFTHQVLSTSQLNTGMSGPQSTPGGIVQLGGSGGFGDVSSQIAVESVKLHELWVWDRDDYVTIQIIEPDILVEPSLRLRNMLIPDVEDCGIHPYTKIQPNEQTGYFWGRTELADLVEPQDLLSVWAADIKRLFGLQIDKLLGFSGWDGITDELYDQQRMAGYVSAPQGASISDLTPKFPPESIQMLEMLFKIIDMISGFDNMLSGKGEPGVRAGNHAGALLKAASPRLRDRSLLVERQLNDAAQLRFDLMLAKDARRYWTDPNKIEESSFLLSNLPDDAFVTVDSHSGSPIFMDDHKELVAFGLKAGFLDGESAIDLLNFPDKDLLISRYREKEKQKQAMVQQLIKADPAAAERLLGGGGGGRRHH